MVFPRIALLSFALALPPLAVLAAWLLQVSGIPLDHAPGWLPWLSIVLSVDAGMGAASPWLWRSQLESFLAQRSWWANQPPQERLWRLGLLLTLYPLLDGLVLVLLGGTLVQMMAFAGVALAAALIWALSSWK